MHTTGPKQDSKNTCIPKGLNRIAKIHAYQRASTGKQKYMYTKGPKQDSKNTCIPKGLNRIAKIHAYQRA
jgi:hypothetical protein